MSSIFNIDFSHASPYQLNMANEHIIEIHNIFENNKNDFQTQIVKVKQFINQNHPLKFNNAIDDFLKKLLVDKLQPNDLSLIYNSLAQISKVIEHEMKLNGFSKFLNEVKNDLQSGTAFLDNELPFPQFHNISNTNSQPRYSSIRNVITSAPLDQVSDYSSSRSTSPSKDTTHQLYNSRNTNSQPRYSSNHNVVKSEPQYQAADYSSSSSFTSPFKDVPLKYKFQTSKFIFGMAVSLIGIIVGNLIGLSKLGHLASLAATTMALNAVNCTLIDENIIPNLSKKENINLSTLSWNTILPGYCWQSKIVDKQSLSSRNF